jgi:hypothetical protein
VVDVAGELGDGDPEPARQHGERRRRGHPSARTVYELGHQDMASIAPVLGLSRAAVSRGLRDLGCHSWDD